MKSRHFLFATAASTFLAFVAATSAFAFQLEDHELITRIAAEEFNACNPEHKISQEEIDEIVSANKNEDLNIGNKWLVGYSHFFNPDKVLDMSRYPSSTRVMILENWIEDHWADESRKEILSDFGHLIHQIQDMSVPLHVIPVMHALGDQFESYRNKKETLVQKTVDCSIFKIEGQVARYFKLIVMSAKETLVVSGTAIPGLKKNGKAEDLRWNELFWLNGDGNSFGEYGPAGNTFGQEKIQAGKDQFLIPAETYEKFRRDQVLQAIRVTKLGLYKIWIQKKLYEKQ